MTTGALGNVTRHLRRLATEHGHRHALVEPGGARVSFSDLEARAAGIASALYEAGAEPGDRFLLVAPTGIPLYQALLGILRAGCTAVLPDLSAPSSWLREQLARLELRGMVGVGRAHLLRLRYPELRGLDLYVSTGGFCPLPHRRLDRMDGPPMRPVMVTSPALITLAGGRTGSPKAMVRHHGLLEAQHALLTDHLALGPGDIDLHTLPFFMLNSLGAGATCVLSDDTHRAMASEPARIAAWIRAERVTVTSGTPDFFSPLVSWLRTRGEALPGLRRLFIGGGRVPTGLLTALRVVAPGARIQVLYATPEADPITAIDALELLDDEATRRGICVGAPVPGTAIKLWLPGKMEAVGLGEVGEIAVSGRHINPRYWTDERATFSLNAPLGGMIWHRTGDLARRDALGRLWLVGRVGEAAGGRYTLEVEGLAEGLDWVVRAAMVSLGDRAVLAVQVDEPPARWIERLAALTRVDRVFELPELPMMPRQRVRVDREVLADLLAGLLVAEDG